MDIDALKERLAKLGGGCDCDGADDFGVDPIDDFDDNVNMEDE